MPICRNSGKCWPNDASVAAIPRAPGPKSNGFSTNPAVWDVHFPYNMRLLPLILTVSLLAASPRAIHAAGAAEETRDAIDAARLFDDGQAMLRAGRYGAAEVTFRTLLYVYPESDLAGQARMALRQAEDLDAQAPVVRSVRFQLPGGLTLEEIRTCFAAREIALAVQQRYEPRDVERARLALQDLLANHGRPAAVKAEVHTVRHAANGGSVEVVFTLAKK